MKIQVLKENLVKAIQMSTKFTSTKAQLPILSYLAIEAGDKGIFVTATSLDMGLKLRMAGKTIEPGSVAIPAKIINELAQSLPLGGVELSTNDSSELVIEAQRTKAKLQTISMDEFPVFPELPVSIGNISVEELKKAYEQIGFSVSNDESRPILTGFVWMGHKGIAAATDGYRLSLSSDKTVWDMGKNGIESIIVPGKAMSQILQVFTDFGCEKMKIGYLKKSQEFMFMGDDIWGVARVLAGEFPKFEGILPGESTIEFQTNREQMLSAVKSVAIFARDSANIMKFSIGPEKVELSANTAQVGEGKVEIEVDLIIKGEGTIAFNSKYLIDFLSHCSGERVGFGMTDSLKPGLFYEVGEKAYKHVIMPVRVKS